MRVRFPLPAPRFHPTSSDIVFENRRKLRYIAFLFPMASGVVRRQPSMSGGHFGGLVIGDEFEWPPPWGPLGGKAHEYCHFLMSSSAMLRLARNHLRWVIR